MQYGSRPGDYGMSQLPALRSWALQFWSVGAHLDYFPLADNRPGMCRARTAQLRLTLHGQVADVWLEAGFLASITAGACLAYTECLGNQDALLAAVSRHMLDKALRVYENPKSQFVFCDPFLHGVGRPLPLLSSKVRGFA